MNINTLTQRYGQQVLNESNPSYLDWIELIEQINESTLSQTEKEYLVNSIYHDISEDTLNSQCYSFVESLLNSQEDSLLEKARRPNAALSRVAKRRWTRYREKYKRALDKYHNSSSRKPFKKTLRSLNNSLSRGEYSPNEQEFKRTLFETLKSLSSAMTHLVIEYEISTASNEDLTEEDLRMFSDISDIQAIIITETTDLLKSSLPLNERFENLKNIVDIGCDIFLE